MVGRAVGRIDHHGEDTAGQARELEGSICRGDGGLIRPLQADNHSAEGFPPGGINHTPLQDAAFATRIDRVVALGASEGKQQDKNKERD